MVTKQLTYTEALEQLNVSYGQEKIHFQAKISTLEVTVSQKNIQIKKQEEWVTDLENQLHAGVDKLAKAQKVVEDNVTTILRLQAESQEGWDLADSYNIKIEELKEELDSMTKAHNSLEEEVKDLGQVKSYLLDERDSLFNALIVLDPGYAPDTKDISKRWNALNKLSDGG